MAGQKKRRFSIWEAGLVGGRKRQKSKLPGLRENTEDID